MMNKKGIFDVAVFNDVPKNENFFVIVLKDIDEDKAEVLAIQGNQFFVNKFVTFKRRLKTVGQCVSNEPAYKIVERYKNVLI